MCTHSVPDNRCTCIYLITRVVLLDKISGMTVYKTSSITDSGSNFGHIYSRPT